MKVNQFLWILISILVLFSISLFIAYYFIFPDLESVIQDMAAASVFLPVEIIFVYIVIDRVLAKREKNTKLNKLNMVAGAFFSETGNPLLDDLLTAVENKTFVFENLGVNTNWSKKDFSKAMDLFKTTEDQVNILKVNLKKLKATLKEDRSFLLLLLENPTLLEHDRFTDMLLAVFHLSEELEARASLDNLTQRDLEHISVDVNRVYSRLIIEWLDYMHHVKSNYPFLYSLNLRIHPLQQNPSPMVV